MDGYVARLTDRGFGFIRDGSPAHPGPKEYFFHRQDCVPPQLFPALLVGMAVRFTVGAPDEKGPRVERVQLTEDGEEGA